ncbi:MAG: tetratricopeptide repeat protein [Proteobacteria bacterium]|nr:tetratricopeptide repeat protein [Pseudomonadota bacterium]
MQEKTPQQANPALAEFLASKLKEGMRRQNAQDYAGAEALYRQVLQAEPNQPDAMHLLGLIAQQAGQSASAIDLIRKAIKVNQHNPDYYHNLGVVYESLKKYDAAIQCNLRAVHLKPDAFASRFSLANDYRLAGRLEEAVAEYRNALSLRPDSAEVYSNLGVALDALGKSQEAVDNLRKALEIQPDQPDMHSNLGMALHSLGNLREAENNYRRATELKPRFATAWANLTETLLEQGKPKEALAAARQSLQLDSGNQAAFALIAIACNELDKTGERDRLLDFSLVRAIDIEPPQAKLKTGRNGDQDSLQFFNTELARHTLSHPSLVFEPTTKSTKKGRQSGELLVEPKGPVAHLEKQIRAAVEDYIARIPDDTDHPFLSRKPEHWQLTAWVTILNREGHQLPHIHPAAWLSGVYYVQVPEQDSNRENAGWIQFGEAPEHLQKNQPMPLKYLEPVPGRMYLFPSYFYHRTVPFAGDRPRISIAFDVTAIPAGSLRPPMSDTEVEQGLARARQLFAEGSRAQADEVAGMILERNPDEHRALHVLARIAYTDGRMADAADYLHRAQTLAPDTAQYHAELSEVLHSLQWQEESAAELYKAIDLGLDNERIYTQLGATLSAMGDFEKAQEAFLRAVDNPATLGTAYYGISMISGFEQQQGLVEKMQEALERTDLPDQELSNLHFALGRACDSGKDYDQAFRHYTEANLKRRQGMPFTLATERNNTRRIIETFTPELFEKFEGCGNPSELPVFIIGMPRSGTTLVEQIIASHPQVHGAGELNDLWRTVEQINSFLPPGGQLPENIGQVKPEAWEFIGNQYVKTINQRSWDALRITDKLPFNYTLAGIIQLMLPKARIIHCRRNPLDTCVSCFTTSFASDRGFTRDLHELGGTYRTYQDLMAHWHEVMPGRILDVVYEELVENTEEQARNLIAHLGLAWDDACLEFFKNKRRVSTSSLVQVRQPVYKTSVGRWRRYEKHLAPLLSAIEEDY